MMSSENRNAALARLSRQHAQSVSSLEKRCDLIESVENAMGLELIKGSYIPDTLDISREQLPMLRNAIGKLHVVSKHPAWDFDTSGELNVTVQSVCDKYKELSFRYRTPLRGNKCRVEKHVTTYNALVCRK